MNRFLVLLTAAWIAYFVGTSLMHFLSPEIRRVFCEKFCDVKGRECASTRGEQFVTYSCGAHKKSTKESLMRP